MSPAAEELLKGALNLDADQRADLAAALLDSLEDSEPSTSQAAWLTEIENRARQALAGETQGRPWDEVRDELARTLDK